MDFGKEFQDTPAASGFALIPEGTYEAEIMDCQLDLTKDPSRMSLTLAITENGDQQGRKCFVNYNLAGQGIGFLKKDLETLGLDYSQVSSEEMLAELIWNAMPMPVMVYIKHKEWQGKTYNNAYINELITAADQDRPAALEKTPPPPAPTNQAEATRRSNQAGQITRTGAPPAGTPAHTQPSPKPAQGARTAAPRNHAPQRAATKPKAPPPGEPNLEDQTDEIPF